MLGEIAPLLASVAGQEALVAELSCLISDAGAPPQAWHPDTLASGDPVFSLFVALQDVTQDMGPTELLLGSHIAEAHDYLSSLGAENVVEAGMQPVHSMELQCGDAFLFDSRLWHRGGGNRQRWRRQLYLTLLPAGGKPAMEQCQVETYARFLESDLRLSAWASW